MSKMGRSVAVWCEQWTLARILNTSSALSIESRQAHRLIRDYAYSGSHKSMTIVQTGLFRGMLVPAVYLLKAIRRRTSKENKGEKNGNYTDFTLLLLRYY